jgi:hypothetical protein
MTRRTTEASSVRRSSRFCVRRTPCLPKRPPSPGSAIGEHSRGLAGRFRFHFTIDRSDLLHWSVSDLSNDRWSPVPVVEARSPITLPRGEVSAEMGQTGRPSESGVSARSDPQVGGNWIVPGEIKPQRSMIVEALIRLQHLYLDRTEVSDVAPLAAPYRAGTPRSQQHSAQLCRGWRLSTRAYIACQSRHRRGKYPDVTRTLASELQRR